VSKEAGPGLAGEVLRFARFLRGHGLRVSPADVPVALQALEAVGLKGRDEMKIVLRACLVRSLPEWIRFEELFETFWERSLGKKAPETSREEEPPAAMEGPPELPKERLWVEPEAEGDKETGMVTALLEGAGYSPWLGVERRDLGRLGPEEIRAARLALARLTAALRLHPSRRRRPARRAGQLDFRKVFRNAVRGGGFPLALAYKAPRPRLKKLVVLADVSGSMDRYASFVLPFLMGLRGIGSRAEVFVFATCLTPVGALVRKADPEDILQRLSERVPDWSGGTRIGVSLRQFNGAFGTRRVTRRTVVVILSDGWDLGAKEVLRKEMAALRGRAHRILWLNPMAADPSAPLAGGMRVALPYVDALLGVDTLERFRAVGRTLAGMMAH